MGADNNKLVAIGNILDNLLSNKHLTGRHRDILSSFNCYYNNKGCLTERQMSFLQNIVNEYSTTPSEWEKEFDEEKRKLFNLAIEYYRNSIYFNDVVHARDFDKSFIPTKRQYQAMCENKYFIRALQYYNVPPRYSVGDMVTFRKNGNYRYRAVEDEIIVGMIESVSDKPSFQNGGRTYDVMWLTSEARKIVREADIKLYREPKGETSSKV